MWLYYKLILLVQAKKTHTERTRHARYQRAHAHRAPLRPMHTPYTSTNYKAVTEPIKTRRTRQNSVEKQ